MNVLSLFDGISCGQVALERAGIEVNNYYASEVDKYAIQVTQKNYPNTIQLGDVTKWQEWEIDWSSIDLLIGGSPCQGFSFAGKQLNFDDLRSKLFFVYADILNHIRKHNPNVKFLLENVKMKKEYQDVISSYLGVEPVEINSSLVSAQNRKRLYWTNIGKIEQPEDKGILLKDIVHENTIPEISPCTSDNKSYALTASYDRTVAWNSYERKQRTMLFESLKEYIVPFDKTLQILEKEVERGKVGFFRKDSQSNRVYFIHDKAITLCGDAGGGAAKMGQYLFGCITPDRVEKRQNGQRFNDGSKFYTLTAQDRHGVLIEGYIRKLTPIECERLQALPDNYTQLGQSYYYYNIYDIINLVIKGELLCKNAKLRDVKTQSRIEKQDCAINIICDISDMEQQNSQETLLNEKKNVLLMDAIINNKQEWVIVLNTIKDLKEQEQQSLKKNLKNVNIVIDWQLQEGCVIGIIKIGSDTEMQNIPIKLEKEQIITDIKNLKENIESSIEKLPQKCWGEIYPLKKLYTTLIWINLIMIKKIYTRVIKTNTQAYIDSLIKLQDNLLKLELSNLKMADTFPISSSQRYKCLGNGWTVDVIAHIFSYLKPKIICDLDI